MKTYSFSQTNDNMFYYMDTNLMIESTYLVTAAVFRMSQLTVTLYENPDFCSLAFVFNVATLNLTFDEHLHNFFETREQQYSLTIQGMVRLDYSNLYNVTVLSNKAVRVYLDQELVFSKEAETKDTHYFVKEMVRHRMYMLEVFIADTQREPEINGTRGFFSMYEECGNTRKRLWKPKNIFQFQHIVGS